MLPMLGRPMLERMIERVRMSRLLDDVVVATTVNATDDTIAGLAHSLGVACHRGSEDDVLQRVLDAAHANNADVVVELTGDCPLIDPAVIDQCIADYLLGGADYVANVLTRSYPIGMDTQVFATSILDDVASRTTDPVDREHVSLYIYRHPELYRLRNVTAPPTLAAPDLALTLDTPDDLTLISAVFEALYPEAPQFSVGEILDFLRHRPDLRAVNQQVRRKHV